MNIIITENQLKQIVENLYYDDKYLRDNDLFNYEPTQSEIDKFNYFDSTGKLPIDEPEKQKIYTGYAKLYYVYPDGRKALIKRAPIAVIKSIKNKKISVDRKHANSYVIDYETK